MVAIRLKLKYEDDVRRVSFESNDYSLSKLHETIRTIYKLECVPSLCYLHKNDSDWEEAKHFALRNNNVFTIWLAENELSESLLKEQNDFVILEDFAASAFEEVKGEQLPQSNPFLSINQFFQNFPTVLGTDRAQLSNVFQQVTTTVDAAIESIKPSLDQLMVNNNSQLEQVVCTVRDTVEDIIKTTSRNVNDFFEDKNVASSDAKPSFDGRGPKLEAKFISDVSVPDGSIVEPESSFTKTWMVKNTGKTAWPEGCSLQFVGGNRLVERDCVEVPSLNIEEQGQVTMNMISPSIPGKYACYFRLCCPVNGTVPFGERLWCEIIVPEPEVEEIEYAFQTQLQCLSEMGFPDEISKQLLEEHNGNMDDVLADLLG